MAHDLMIGSFEQIGMLALLRADSLDVEKVGDRYAMIKNVNLIVLESHGRQFTSKLILPFFWSSTQTLAKVLPSKVTRFGGQDFGQFLKPLATINLPQSSPFFGNTSKGVKIIHFPCETIIGQLLLTFGDFIWSL